MGTAPLGQFHIEGRIHVARKNQGKNKKPRTGLRKATKLPRVRTLLSLHKLHDSLNSLNVS
jgi:hypothetical protein